MPLTSVHETSNTIKPYKVLCNSLIKSKWRPNVLTGSKALFWDRVTASINENHLLTFSDLIAPGVVQLSFPSFLCLRALVFANGDSLDCINKTNLIFHSEENKENSLPWKAIFTNLGNHQLPQVCWPWILAHQPWSVVHQNVDFLTFKCQKEAKIWKIGLQIPASK